MQSPTRFIFLPPTRYLEVQPHPFLKQTHIEFANVTSNELRSIGVLAALHLKLNTIAKNSRPGEERQAIVWGIQQTKSQYFKMTLMSINVTADERIQHHRIVALISILEDRRIHLHVSTVRRSHSPLHHTHFPRSLRRYRGLAIYDNPFDAPLNRKYTKPPNIQMLALTYVVDQIHILQVVVNYGRGMQVSIISCKST